MFTGIVTRRGTIESLERVSTSGRMVIQAALWERPLELGESIAVNGVCLTLAEQNENQLSFDILTETFEKTNLGAKVVGHQVNLERALAWGDPLGGHVVSGHVDGVGTIQHIESIDQDFRLDIACDSELLAGMIYKGSICLDGISLTIADLREDGFSVHLIPHTWNETTLQGLSMGDSVNLEIDLMGKFYRSMLERGTLDVSITWEVLRSEGLIS